MIYLKEVVTKYPECLESTARFRGYLADLYPDAGDRARIKVLADAMDCGIVEEIQKGKTDSASMERYRNLMEQCYGYSLRLIVECLRQWTEALAVEEKEVEINSAPQPQAVQEQNDEIHVHKFQDTVVPATCKERGYTLHRCQCGYEYRDQYTPIGAHQFELVDELKPTCTQTGRKDYLCAVCSAYRSDEIPMLPHDFGDWEIVEEASCELSGKKERKCCNCAKTETEKIPSLGHNWGEWTTQAVATCTEDGKEVRQCTRCKKVEERTIPATGHDFSEWEKSQSQEGMMERYCRHCAAIETKDEKQYCDELEADDALKELEKELSKIKKPCTIGQYCLMLIMLAAFGFGALAGGFYILDYSQIKDWTIDTFTVEMFGVAFTFALISLIMRYIFQRQYLTSICQEKAIHQVIDLGNSKSFTRKTDVLEALKTCKKHISIKLTIEHLLADWMLPLAILFFLARYCGH